MSSVAFAQTAPTQPAPTTTTAPAPAAQPQQVTVNVATPAAQAQAHVDLTSDEQELLADGEISGVAHIGGGLASIFLGFGIGQAVEGRWGSRGWIFTVGETGSLGLMIYGMAKSASSCVSADGESCGGGGLALMGGGLLAFSGLRVWEMVDAWVAPIGHNRKVRALQLRTGMRPAYARVTPYVLPPRTGDGAVAGFSLSF